MIADVEVPWCTKKEPLLLEMWGWRITAVVDAVVAVVVVVLLLLVLVLVLVLVVAVVVVVVVSTCCCSWCHRRPV